MKKILIHCEKKFVDSLLNNSPFFSKKDYYNCSTDEISEILEIYGITITDRKVLLQNENDYDIIIIDDLSDYNTDNTSLLYFFIQPIDFNIADPFIMSRWPESTLDSVYKNKLLWANNKFPNLKFLGSNLYQSENQIFDLSLVLNLNNHSDNWGKYHFAADKLFKAINQKSYRLDYTFREVKKENRVKFLFDLINILDEKEIGEIKVSMHGGFLNNETYYKDVEEFFKSQQNYSLFLELIKLDRRFFSFDELLNPKAGYEAWPVNKLINNTLSSDISIYFETAREKAGIQNTMNFLITEKTIDLLNVRKPFIHMTKNVDEFLEKFGFINYNKDIFESIESNKPLLVKEILNMEIQHYEVLIQKLKKAADDNKEILDSYYKNNTFLYNLVHN